MAVVLLFLLATILLQAEGSIFPVPPSKGDLAAVDKQLLISLAPDGLEEVDNTFSLCVNYDDAKLVQNVTDVVCRTLGFLDDEYCEVQNVVISTSTYKKMQIVSCNKEVNHILRCKLGDKNDNCTEIYLSKSSTEHGLRFKEGNHAYLGQVLLYPPAHNKTERYQISFGLVGVKNLNGHYWTLMKKDSNFHAAIPMTLCRQMGYSSFVESYTMTGKEAAHDWSYNFTKWNVKTFSTSTVQCDRSSRCLGCCDYSKDGYTNNVANFKSNSKLNTDDALFIRCTYSTVPPVASGGDELACKLNLETKKLTDDTVCDTGRSGVFFAAVTGLPILAMLALIILVLFTLLALRSYRRRGYLKVPEREINLQPSGQ